MTKVNSEKRLEILADFERTKENLPHLYGRPHYQWSKDFFESNNKINVLCAANQISKSSVLIRRMIDRATNVDKWAEWWPSTPKQFWYFYPKLQICTSEFENKWIPEWLPRGPMKDHPQYGWKPEYNPSGILAIHFNTGVSIYFKSYEMKPRNLQAGSVFEMALDEEIPSELVDELLLRCVAPLVQGRLNFVFTATMGQQFWYDVVEKKGKRGEIWPDAFKRQVSMYDCLKYADGSKTPWTVEYIKAQELNCKSEAERQRRIYGRFIVSDDRTYPSFDKNRHLVAAHPIPKNWQVYVGVDPGGGGFGGKKGHRAAIAFVGINPEFTSGRIFKLWMSPPGHIVTAADIFNQYLGMKRGVVVTRAFYDWASKDFYTIASRSGEPFEAAEKSHDIGVPMLDSLFQYDALKLYTDTPDCEEAADQFEALQRTTQKNHAVDDAIDAVRYAVTKGAWDWERMLELSQDTPQDVPKGTPPLKKRSTNLVADDPFLGDDILRELNEWQGYYEV